MPHVFTGKERGDLQMAAGTGYCPAAKGTDVVLTLVRIIPSSSVCSCTVWILQVYLLVPCLETTWQLALKGW